MDNKNWEFFKFMILAVISVVGALAISIASPFENAFVFVMSLFGLIITISAVIYFLPHLKRLIFNIEDPKENPSRYLLIGLDRRRPRAKNIELKDRIRNPKI